MAKAKEEPQRILTPDEQLIVDLMEASKKVPPTPIDEFTKIQATKLNLKQSSVASKLSGLRGDLKGATSTYFVVAINGVEDGEHLGQDIRPILDVTYAKMNKGEVEGVKLIKEGFVLPTLPGQGRGRSGGGGFDAVALVAELTK